MSRDEQRRAILEVDDRPRELVHVPWELDEPVYVRALSLADYKRFMAAEGDIVLSPKMMAEVVCECLVTEDGEQILRAGDAAKLATKNARVIMALCATIMRLSSLTEESQEQVEADFDGARNDATSSE